MLELTHYTATAEIYIGAKTNVYRGYHTSEKYPVIIKSLSRHPEPKRVAQLHHEYEITKELDLPGIIKSYELQRTTDSWALICEDIQGDALKRILADHPFDLVTILRVAIQLAQGLGELHKHNIIHKDIKPANIIINLKTGQTKITDFSISSRLSSENQSLIHPNLLEGTLAYMSPEQTGRMNRTLDYRTDFYSLGVVLYEMLVGHSPFQSLEAMELVHCHIAKQPIPPHKLDPKIPSAISYLVMKLLSKTAEARYQSGFGLKADLEVCLQQLQSTGWVEEFTYGQWDISDKLQISQKLYGREIEINTLLQTIERISYGATEMIVVTGYSGIGKSALVQEIYKPITRKRGFFIAGKFDQFQRNVPFSAIVSAFSKLVHQLLTESEQQLEHWRKKLLTALGINGQVVIEVIPEIALILGAQPPLQELGFTETQNRFSLVFQNFIRVFCNPKHPLVIFLDDLQWIDTASLKLIELMMTDKETRGFLLIGAYRDNEVTVIHPLLTTLQTLHEEQITINRLNLMPLALDQINQLLVETLHSDEETVQSLAELLVSKTDGNPFFINQFLKTLYEETLLTFDPDQPCWRWDIVEIQKINITDNVIDLMINKLKKLPVVTQQVLQLAACVGHHFDLNTLSIIHEKSASATYHDLLAAIQEGLIIPISELAMIDIDEMYSQFLIFDYEFLHDRVQQAAYALIDNDQKKSVHLLIGELLLLNTPKEKQGDRFFEIVDHLNMGRELITGIRDRAELAELNLMTARRAKHAMAYSATVGYLTIGLTLLPETSWQSDYELTFELHLEMAEVSYLNTDFERAERFATLALAQAKTALERVRVHEIIIQFYIAQDRLKEAVNTALVVLTMLGITLDSSPHKEMTIQDCYHLPEMKIPEKLAAMRILNTAISSAYTIAPELVPSIAFTMVNLSIQYGNSAFSAYSYSIYGLLLCSVLGDIESGYQAGQLAHFLLEKFALKKLKAKILTADGVAIMPWKKHAQETILSLTSAMQSGLETGDMEYACIAAMHCASYRFWLGEPLETVLQRQNEYLAVMNKVKQKYQPIYVNIWRQTVLNLISKETEQCCLKGEAFDEEDLLPVLLESNYGMAIFATYLAKLFLYYLCGDYEQAIANAELAEDYEQANSGIMVVAICKFYYTLALLAHYAEVGAVRQQVYLHLIEKNQTQLEMWAHYAPMNYQHRCKLIAAEKARILRQPLQAMEYYDQAIQGAKTHGYLQEEALANELAARFWLERDKTEFANVYLEKAHYNYQLWGAKRKVEALEKQYPQLVEKPYMQDTLSTTTNATVFTPVGSDELDLAAVAKASQAISSEIVLETLVQKMLKIVMENAGAQKSLLILQEQGQFFLKAVSEADVEKATFFEGTNLEENTFETQLPITLINYVIRTGKDTLLNDVSSDEMFINDPYMQQYQPKSILCIPILYHGQLIGIMYLENSLTAQAFSANHLAVLKTLSGQIAISLKNALLYQQNTKACQEAEAASRVKSTFLATMSHELRTPLNGILGYAQILGRDKCLTPKQREGIDIIQNSGNHLLTLINDILDLSKIETGRMELHKVDFALRDFLHNIVESFRVRAKQKGLTFVYRQLTNLPLGVFGDEKRLRQIIVNLLSNAVKFTRKGSITCKMSYENEKLRLWIEDTGIGIAPEMQAKIFLPFQQADGDYYKDKAEGTGVGLYVAKTLVEKMGGELQVESTVGQGSIFWTELTLPETTVYVKSSQDEEQIIMGYQRLHSDAQSLPIKILIIDNEQDNRSLLVDLLTPLSFEVTEASNGQEGLEKAHTFQPDLILIDFVMPVMDGFTTIRLLRDRQEFEKLIIVGCSGSFFTYEQRELCRVGCDAFIPKPLQIETLLTLLQESLRLTWVYKPTVTEEPLVEETIPTVEVSEWSTGPSTEQATTLFDLAMMGDIKGILQCVEELEQANEALVPFSKQVRELAKDFAEERICDLVQQFL